MAETRASQSGASDPGERLGCAPRGAKVFDLKPEARGPKAPGNPLWFRLGRDRDSREAQGQASGDQSELSRRRGVPALVAAGLPCRGESRHAATLHSKKWPTVDDDIDGQSGNGPLGPCRVAALLGSLEAGNARLRASAATPVRLRFGSPKANAPTGRPVILQRPSPS
jgi:hypothetical protein